MSRFKHLRQFLPFSEALKVYLKMKQGDYNNWYSSILRMPSVYAKGIFLFFTYDEVSLKKSYNIPFSIPPKSIINGDCNIELTAAFFATQISRSEHCNAVTRQRELCPTPMQYLHLQKHSSYTGGYLAADGGSAPKLRQWQRLHYTITNTAALKMIHLLEQGIYYTVKSNNFISKEQSERHFEG
jgi:hypothetical protein